MLFLDEPSEFYSDEVHYGVTALAYYQGDPNAYDPSYADKNDRSIYAWAHPPLGKLIIAGSILLLGPELHSLRIGPVVASVVAIFLSAYFCFLLLASINSALITALLLSVDGLFFTQSRVATLDIFVVCFSLAALVCFVEWVKKRASLSRRREFILILSCGVFLGMGIATKWTGVFTLGFVCLALCCLILRRCKEGKSRNQCKSMHWWALSLTVVPMLVYLASYIQFFILGFSFEQFFQLQHLMLDMHANLQTAHPYASRPIEWIFDLRPNRMYHQIFSDGTTACIYNLGNPILFFGGLVAMFACGIEFLRTKRIALLFIFLAYLSVWIPWLFTSRVMFMYYYLPAVPFLAIALAHYIGRWMAVARLRRWVWVTLISSMIWFLLFYPNMVAVQVPIEFANEIYGFIPSWR